MNSISGIVRRLVLCIGLLLATLSLFAAAAWYALPVWLPALAGRYLPDGVHLRVAERPVWRRGGVTLAEIALHRGDCVWLDAGDIRFKRADGLWRVGAGRVRLDTTCVSGMPGESGGDIPWRAMLDKTPPLSLTIERLDIAPWDAYAGRLAIEHRRSETRARYDGERLTLDVRVQGDRLSIGRAQLRDPISHFTLSLDGDARLSPHLNALPAQGSVRAELSWPGGMPLSMALDWRQKHGVFTIDDRQTGARLARLPWRIDDGDTLVIAAGEWRWPYGVQPLSGNLSISLGNWRADLPALDISARMNILTGGVKGRANAVLNLGPGRVGLTDNALDFHLTGQANQGALALYATIPGQLRGPLFDPTLVMGSGSLLRVVGPVLSGLNISSARLPLAGMRLSSQGFNGRLQAILAADADKLGRFTLHLDGRAKDFWPDRGEWRWRYWGNGHFAPFRAHWHISGTGNWLADVIELDQLNSGLSQINYGLARVDAPRLSLVSPVRWRRDAAQPSFSGALRLTARRIAIQHGGEMSSPRLDVQLDGRGPQDFLWCGWLGAGPMGPIRLTGRWDGRRFRGQAWWPQQPLRVFQSLLSPGLPLTLHDGVFHAQSAFSAAVGQGFLAGGHAVVSRADVWYGENRLRGISLGLSYRLRDQRWQLGVKAPVSLKIASITAPVNFDHLAVDVQGYYPYDTRHPLTLTAFSAATLGGEISLSPLSLPQREAAIIRLRSLETSDLITALNVRQFALSGRISGELPVDFADPRGYIRRGRLTNDRAMTLRLDPQFADQIAGRNLATGAAIGWLRYLEISRVRAAVALDRRGNLLLQAQLSGRHPQNGIRREVRLNYRHEENVFQLWRSLRFGTQVEQTLEKQAALPEGAAR
ncbi:YdbH family protein [Martelella alba]|uniref:YdbH family protein n=1 Tax=Martelella alba TaxID=2590451 RepID=A0ABY2SST9_9HYPH|nr:YdbH family protein [Martelella alba]TKI08078.1 YdbH family protein [Martelella alba]